jgi:hypothetical protein
MMFPERTPSLANPLAMEVEVWERLFEGGDDAGRRRVVEAKLEELLALF